MKPVLLVDFGSTYTKATAVEAESGQLLGTAQSYTTVEQDISLGLENALKELKAQTGLIGYEKRYACSSAAGGLRMIASGLVPSLTSEAAKRAALGAGAKVIRTYAYELTEDDTAEIAALAPDILLLCGGTDGGNSACALHNAQAIAAIDRDFPVVVACNRACAKKCAEILTAAGREAIVTENVMPQFNSLNIEPCQKVIREVFLRRIIQAKGLSRMHELISGILMPTPAAVLQALTVLSEELGELCAVDLGGATTDIYSITEGLPTKAGTVLRGLPEPYAKRTVEGDIGMRYSAHGVLEAVGLKRLCANADVTEEQMTAWLARIHENKGILPRESWEQQADFALATTAIEVGLARHAGEIEAVYTPMGLAYQQTGKDLTRVKQILLTGGALIHTGKAVELAQRAMATACYPNSLMPRQAQAVVDRHYILSAMGLLSQYDRTLAKTMMIKEFL
ncbi:MAG: glutamate mutase L [Clostridia bacterium]|nr:glutamate mutase L [Clostridia bacterium]